jgi:hypothetical protein
VKDVAEPSQYNDTAWPAPKPTPLIWTEAPTKPVSGEIVIPAVTIKGAVRFRERLSLGRIDSARTVAGPGVAEAGTWNEVNTLLNTTGAEATTTVLPK